MPYDLRIEWNPTGPGAPARYTQPHAIDWGWFSGPFGPALVMGTAQGICALGFAPRIGHAPTLHDLKARWPEAVYGENPARLSAWADAALNRQSGTIPLCVTGSPFQIDVWKALVDIPWGAVRTYGQIARAIGHPGAARAVGTAVGRNPISFLIPCHRVMRASGGLGGYHWGVPVKRAILAWEAARPDAGKPGPGKHCG